MHKNSGGLQALVIAILLLGQTRGVSPTHSPDDRDATANSDSRRQDLIKAFEASLLNMFGLKSRPKPDRKIHIPQQMLDLYRSQMQSDELDIGANPVGTSANTVRSFHHNEDNALHIDNDPNRIVYVFNASALPPDEELTGAELRIHREGVSEKDLEASSVGDQNTKKPYRHRINIYEVLRPASKSRETITRLLDTRLVDVRNSSWESFDIRPAVLKWKNFPQLNHGLEVHFTKTNGRSTSLQHVRLRRSADTDEKRWHGRRPILMTYSNDAKAIKAKRTRRNPRRRSRSSRRHKARRKGKDECRRHPLYVDFSDVGWNDWIVAPPGYHAYYCHGECPFPLADYMNSTNHAIVQTLVHAVNRNAVPRACCVPTELSSISMLYLDEYGKVVLKKYQDMVVEGCGCR